MDDITKTPYAEWLEQMLREIMARKPVRMAVVMITEKGETVTGYYGDHSPEDIGFMAMHMQFDSIWQLIGANADKILEMAQQTEEEEPDDAD